MLWLALMTLLSAQAAGPEVWAALNDGRLIQSTDRDSEAAVAIYETVLRHLPDDDPLRGELLFWMGRARYEAGDLEGASSALLQAAHDVGQHDAARSLLGRILFQSQVVRDLPYHEDFFAGRGDWIRGWPRGQDEDLAVEEIDDDPALVWQTWIREGQDDFIVLALGPFRVGPQRLRLRLRTREHPAHMRLAFDDSDGLRWTSPELEIDSDGWSVIELGMEDFTLTDAANSGRHPDPRRLRALVLRDVTAFHDLQRGENHILVDDVELR